MPRTPRLALGLQALIFAVYHIGMFRVAPTGAVISAIFVTFLAGIGWGWQVKRDGTVIWAMIHHTLLQIILKLFVWG
jgi:membrane protease YdiL (CAAX protease family)